MASGHGEVGGGLDPGRIPRVLGLQDLDRHRRGIGAVSASVASAAYPRLGQDRGIDPVGEVPQLPRTLWMFLAALTRATLAGVSPSACAAQANRMSLGQAQQPLLGAAVQVPLQPAAFGVGSVDDAGTGGAGFLELATSSACRRSFSGPSPMAGPMWLSAPGTSPECETAAMVRSFLVRRVPERPAVAKGSGTTWPPAST
jgi:hypothetical protein